MFNELLVCLDGSPLAEQILPYATEQALRFKSKVTLLQVVAIPSTIAAISATGVPPPSTENIIKEEVQQEMIKAKEYLEHKAQPLRKKGLDVTCVCLEGLPGDTIVSYAATKTIDLIAIATHGRSGLKRLVFGSVTEHVLRESGIPILIIKPQEKK
ncbi:universal stress protein [Chloroflexota bacterium]